MICKQDYLKKLFP